MSTTYLTLTSRKVWQENKSLVVVAIAAIAIFTFGSTIASTIWGKVSEGHSAKIADVREALIGAMFTAQQLTQTDVREINAVFLVRRWGLTWRLKKKDYLDPTVRAEFGAHEPSTVSWEKGKGVVGLAWAKEQAQFRDVRAIYEKRKNCTAEDWERANAETRMELTFADWERTQGKYGTIVAACTRNGRSITGVVAMNAPLSADWTAHEKNLKNLMVLTGQTVANVLK